MHLFDNIKNRDFSLLRKLALFSFATIGAIYLINWSLNAFGFRSPVFAFLVNWLLLSWVTIVGQSISLNLPQRYFEIKVFERSERIYKSLGVRLFKRLVRRGPLTIFNQSLRCSKGMTRSYLPYLEQFMRKAETGHLSAAILMLLFIGYALLRGWFDAVGWMLLFNVIINGYPVMLQRYNRIRLQKLITKKRRPYKSG